MNRWSGCVSAIPSVAVRRKLSGLSLFMFEWRNVLLLLLNKSEWQNDVLVAILL